MSDTKVGFNGLVDEVGKTPDAHLSSDGSADVILSTRSCNGKGIKAGTFSNSEGDSNQNAAQAPNNWSVTP
jgi:hypothetical protein